MNHIATGKLAEDLAQTYLASKRMKLLERNYRCHFGEIDLIMQDNDVIVFVEVRARSKTDVMHVIETIDRRKKTHIINASEHFLQQHNLTYSCVCRFDLVLFNQQPAIENLQWIKNAFEI